MASRFKTPGLLLTAAAALTSQFANAQGSCDSNDLEVSYPAPEAADGWRYRLVAEGLTKPRGILFDSEGGLLVVDGGVGLLHYSFSNDGGTCVSVRENTTLIENEDVSHAKPNFLNSYNMRKIAHLWHFHCSSIMESPSQKTGVPSTPPQTMTSSPGPTTLLTRAPSTTMTAEPSSPT